jgi:UDP-N-acetylmuramate: L-alanyl-gamma-D-glutamyl-meso-diaminopimelate ligase
MFTEKEILESEVRSQIARELPKGSHVHLGGICGTGMASVAQLLKMLGFKVTGSDKAFYPPMGEVVRKTADKIYEGYDPKNLDERPDLYVVGNNLGKTNPEVLRVLEGKIPYVSMPELFQGLLIGTREECPTSIVVTGTHGKSTTTAAVASLLESVGRKPGFFVGGMPKNFTSSIRPVDQSLPLQDRIVVLEGDEYDSAFFAKWSKFHSYRADIVILNALEFDHGDIYESLDQIIAEFDGLVSRMPKGTTVLICDEGENLDTLAKKWSDTTEVTVERFGSNMSSRFQLVSRESIPDPKSTVGAQLQKLTLHLDEVQIETVTPMSGKYNALNILAACAACILAGISAKELAQAIPKFEGVVKRQEILKEAKGILVLQDFAHHPTAIAAALEGLRETYPNKRIIAVYEPASATARRQYYQEMYPKAFQLADVAIIKAVQDPGSYSKFGGELQALDVEKVVADIQKNNQQAFVGTDSNECLKILQNTIQPGDLICFMTNSDFGGIVGRFVQEL